MCSFVVGGGDTILASHAVVCDVYALMHVNVNSCVCVCVCVCVHCMPRMCIKHHTSFVQI